MQNSNEIISHKFIKVRKFTYLESIIPKNDAGKSEGEKRIPKQNGVSEGKAIAVTYYYKTC